jgi:hypothetical protein
MYSVNLNLRTFISLALTIVVIFINNYYLFWLLLFYMLLLSIVDRNYKTLLVNFAIALVLLFCYYNSKIKLLLKILFIINILITYFSSFGKKEKLNIRYMSMYGDGTKTRKNLFITNYKERIVNYNKEMVSKLYKKDISIKDKVSFDLDNFYSYGRTRFFGYSNKITNMNNEWTWYDTLFLLAVIIVFVLLFIYW